MNSEILKVYEETFESFLQEILTNERRDVPDQILQRLELLIRHTVKPQMEARGLLVPVAYKTLSPDADSEKLQLARILGWCWQTIVSYACTLYDYYEKTEVRHEKPSWNSIYGNDVIVVNDAAILQSVSFKMLKKYFGKSQACSEMLMLFSNYSSNFLIRQYFDKDNDSRNDPQRFTMETYESQVKLLNGTAVTTPIKLAYTLAKENGVENAEWTSSLDLICSGFAFLLTFVEDYKNIYGEAYGNDKYDDINRGKVTWFILKAKEISSDEQWDAIIRCCGNKKDNPIDVKIVLETFEELEISGLCKIHHKSMIQGLKEQIKELDIKGQKIAKFFRNFLELVISYEK